MPGGGGWGSLSPALGRDATRSDSFLQRAIVALVLVGVGLRKRSQRAIEALAGAEIARDGERVTGTCVGLRERLCRRALRTWSLVRGFIVSTSAEPLPSQSCRR